MAISFIDIIVQLLIWGNLIASLLLVVLIDPNRQDVFGRIHSKLTANTRNLIGLAILWSTVLFLLPILFVPKEFQTELIVAMRRNFVFALFPIGPMLFCLGHRKRARLKHSKRHGPET